MNKVIARFIEITGNEPQKVFFSPGRINLIGEHIDYNGGHVFPCAISLGIYGSINKRNDSTISIESLNVKNNGTYTCDLNSIPSEYSKDWYDYPIGIIKNLIDKGYKIDKGFDIVFDSDLPNGAGLSSSAALELLIMEMLNDAFELAISRLDMVKIAQYSENTYNHVNCGIMDQFAVGFGKNNNAIYLNTNTLEYSYAPISLNHYKLLIVNSGKRRSLSSSNYNNRREECEEALKIVQSKYQVRNLCDISLNQLKSIEPLFENKTIYKRAKHVVSENERTKKAYEALLKNDIETFGTLMYDSHFSLKRDFEVSCFELNKLVYLAKKYNAKGARMTGAGFGGCIIVLIKESKIHQFKDDLMTKYVHETGFYPSVYEVDIVDGTGRVR